VLKWVLGLLILMSYVWMAVAYTEGMSDTQRLYFFVSFAILPLSLFVWIVPFWRILPKFGIPSPVALITVFPVTVPVLLWVMAFKSPVQNGEAA